MKPVQARITSANAIVGIWCLCVSVFVVATLYFMRDILIPLALASLLTFLLAPLVSRLERWVGRVLAVLLVVALIFTSLGATGWMLSRQVIDLATQLPAYKENIRTKLQSLHTPQGGTITKLSETVEDLKHELPGSEQPTPPVDNRPSPEKNQPKHSPHPPAPAAPMAVQVVDTHKDNPFVLAESMIAPLVGPLGSAALVLVLVVCMLFQRENMRNRLIRLIGQGRISTTSRAMDDAGKRVSRYLLMQLLVNATYGTVIAIGLHFIGIPNAVLWGALGMVLRFIPYAGAWVAMILPTILALAISPSWTVPLLTVVLFGGLELLLNNVMEPLLYGAHTGVSNIALIIAAVFWTWLWGPVGLVLATPLTVCLVVMGRHVPRLAFLSVLLSDEQALTPAEDCYYRLLTPGDRDEWEFIETYLKNHPRINLYDTVLLPVLSAMETDARADAIDETQRRNVENSVKDIVEELKSSPSATPDPAAGEPVPPTIERHVCCVPARAYRDELAGAMLVQLLHERGFAANTLSGHFAVGEIIRLVEQSDADAVVISVVAPTTATHARRICERVRQHLPLVKIVVGLWYAGENVHQSTNRLREAGADAVVTTLAEALGQLAQLVPAINNEAYAAPIPADEDLRCVALEALQLPSEASPALDRLCTRIARVFDVSLAAVGIVEHDRLFFIGQCGLPECLVHTRQTQRKTSVAGHVVARNATIIIEDLARDRRFAGNPFRLEFGFRFLACTPLHAPDGQPIGVLSLADAKPRQFPEREARLFDEYAAEVEELLAQR